MTRKFSFKVIGEVGQAWGTDGGVRLHISEQLVPILLAQTFCFIRHSDGSPVPYSLEEVDSKGAQFVIWFDGIHSPDEARKISGQPILLANEQLSGEEVKVLETCTESHHPWQGYMIEDETTKGRFQIERVEEYPQQLMAVIEGEQLIPLHDSFILSVNESSRVIVMDLPEGLIQLK